MAPRPPQNPIYPVDPTAFQVCLPKVCCPSCGTVMTLPYRKATGRVFPCTNCGTLLRIEAGEGCPARAVRFEGDPPEPEQAAGAE